MLQTVLTAIDNRRDPAVAALCEFLRIPSVSTKDEHRADVQRCATWLAEQLALAGLSARVEPTAGHPAVVARNAHQPGRPTVLFYGHYDVQPADPLDQWLSPPFEPTLRKDPTGHDAIYARGAADDKGQVWAHVEAIRAWNQHAGGLGINLIALIEGEEEIGSVNLESFIRQHRESLRADTAVISDTGQFARGVPAITYGLRGLVYMELTVTGPDHDLHSGIAGGSVANPANVLCQLLSTLHDRDHRVTVEGFYDDAVPLTDSERQSWRGLPFDEQAYAAEMGLTSAQMVGETGYRTLERRWGRPTCDINGLTSGYQSPGAKTIIPSSASAKVSMRLVPNQDPVKIAAAFERTLRQRCPQSVRLDVVCHSACAAVLVEREGPAMRIAADAVRSGFGVAPVLMREGGSIPIVNTIKSVLGMDTLLIGLGLPDDRVHSPNEKFDLDALYRGTRTAAALYAGLAQL